LLRPVPKLKTIKDLDYIKWIKTFNCIVCGKHDSGIRGVGSDHHHIPEKGHGSMGAKTSDRRVIPLCYQQHREYHDTGRDTFAAKHRLDYELLIEGLNALYEEQKDV
jgi:hypothetical protein